MSIIQTPNIGNLGDIVAGNGTPLVYKVSNSRFPLNTADTVFDITAAAAGVFTVITTDAAADYNLNEPLKVVLGDVSGTYQVTRKISSTQYEINLRYTSLSIFSGTAQRTYRNYRAVLEVYSGLPPEHPKASMRPIRKVADLYSTPDANNVSVFNVSQEVLADIQPIKSDFSQFSASPFCTPILTVFSTSPEWLSFLLADSDITAFWVSELNFSSLYHFGNISNVEGLFFDNPSDADDNAGVIGTVNLQNFTDLQNFRARNQNITLFLGSWVRDAGVTIDVTNSIVNGLAAMIDRLIIANGGTLNPADTTTFTGTAGETALGRLLALGSITLDLSAPANALLLSKIQALEVVGWTITTIITVCNKSLRVRTLSASFAATTLEQTVEVVSLVKEVGEFLLPTLYDTLANAQTGGATGVLATDITGINNYLATNTWAAGVRGIRFAAFDPLDTGNVSLFTYKAFPTASRACGAIIDVLGLQAVSAYSTRMVLQANYTGNFYTTNNGNNVAGNLITLFDQAAESRNITKANTNNLVVASSAITNPSKGLDNYETVANAFNVTRNVFTIVTRFEITATGTMVAGVYSLQKAANDNRILIIAETGNNFGIRAFTGAATAIFSKIYPMPVAQQNVVALVRNGSQYQVYLNGLFIDGFTESAFPALEIKQNRIFAAGSVDSNRPSIAFTEGITYFDALDAGQVLQVTDFINS
jgi:hypothetical protein